MENWRLWEALVRDYRSIGISVYDAISIVYSQWEQRQRAIAKARGIVISHQPGRLQ